MASKYNKLSISSILIYYIIFGVLWIIFSVKHEMLILLFPKKKNSLSLFINLFILPLLSAPSFTFTRLVSCFLLFRALMIEDDNTFLWVIFFWIGTESINECIGCILYTLAEIRKQKKKRTRKKKWSVGERNKSIYRVRERKEGKKGIYKHSIWGCIQ